MASTRLRLRLVSLLLGLCVLLASVGVPLTARTCRMSGRARVTLALPLPATPTADACCAAENRPAPPLPLAISILKASDCCTLAVGYHHVVVDATGPVFALHLSALAAILPVLLAWPARPAVALPASRVLRLFGTDSSPPGRLVGWALVRALHQLRN